VWQARWVSGLYATATMYGPAGGESEPRRMLPNVRLLRAPQGYRWFQTSGFAQLTFLPA